MRTAPTVALFMPNSSCPYHTSSNVCRFRNRVDSESPLPKIILSLSIAAAYICALSALGVSVFCLIDDRTVHLTCCLDVDCVHPGCLLYSTLPVALQTLNDRVSNSQSAANISPSCSQAMTHSWSKVRNRRLWCKIKKVHRNHQYSYLPGSNIIYFALIDMACTSVHLLYCSVLPGNMDMLQLHAFL